MSNTPSEELRLLLQEARSALWQPANAELCERIDDALARWGTPQPVLREPLTDGQIAEMMRETWGCASIAPRHAMVFARTIEHAHGITGGQHGD